MTELKRKIHEADELVESAAMEIQEAGFLASGAVALMLIEAKNRAEDIRGMLRQAWRLAEEEARR